MAQKKYHTFNILQTIQAARGLEAFLSGMSHVVLQRAWSHHYDLIPIDGPTSSHFILERLN